MYTSSTSSNLRPVGGTPSHSPRCVPEHLKCAATFSPRRSAHDLHLEIRERSPERLHPALRDLSERPGGDLIQNLEVAIANRLLNQPTHQPLVLLSRHQLRPPRYFRAPAAHVVQPHDSPRQALRPSVIASAAMPSATSGSSHQMPNTVLASNPPRTATAR